MLAMFTFTAASANKITFMKLDVMKCVSFSYYNNGSHILNRLGDKYGKSLQDNLYKNLGLWTPYSTIQNLEGNFVPFHHVFYLKSLWDSDDKSTIEMEI